MHPKIFLSFQKPYSQLPISFLFFEQMRNSMYDEKNVVRTIEQKIFSY